MTLQSSSAPSHPYSFITCDLRSLPWLLVIHNHSHSFITNDLRSLPRLHVTHLSLIIIKLTITINMCKGDHRGKYSWWSFNSLYYTSNCWSYELDLPPPPPHYLGACRRLNSLKEYFFLRHFIWESFLIINFQLRKMRISNDLRKIVPATNHMYTSNLMLHNLQICI